MAGRTKAFDCTDDDESTSDSTSQFSLAVLVRLTAAVASLIATLAAYRGGRIPQTPWETSIVNLGLVVATSWFFVNTVPRKDASIAAHLLVGFIVGALSPYLVISLIAQSGPSLAVCMLEDDWGGWIPYRNVHADGLIFRILAGTTTGWFCGCSDAHPCRDASSSRTALTRRKTFQLPGASCQDPPRVYD